MGKQLIGEFLRWLDTASETELLDRRRRLLALRDDTDDREVRRDISFLLRLLEEERLARWEVARQARR